MFCLFYIIPIISSLYSKNSNTSAKLLIKFGLCKKLAESLLRKDKLSKFVRVLDVLYPPTIKDNYRLGDDIQSKVLAFAFGLSAEIERNLISQRTKEALARKKSEGVQLGRPKGKISSQETYKLHRKERLIRDLRAEGVSFAKIGNILKVNRDTVRRYYHTFLEEKNEKMPTLLRISK